MTAFNFEEETDGGRGTTRSQRNTPARTSTSNRKTQTPVFSTAMLLDIVERAGVVDMVVERVKGRVEEVDIDEVIDEVVAYVKRNPEVLVVALGAITVAAGALVFMEKKSDRFDDAPRTQPSSNAQKSRGGSQSKGKSGNARNR
jgi:hypothetical protein